MGLYKLREWVGTVTGKGDRWGRDRIGRSAPAFLSATALPPLTCTARGRTSSAAVVCCEAGQLWAVCSFEACAGRRVRRLCPPAVACSAGCVPVARLCHAHCPSQHFAPVHFALPPPVHSMCARIVKPTVCKLRELFCWQLQHGPAEAARAPVHLTALFLFLQSP